MKLSRLVIGIVIVVVAVVVIVWEQLAGTSADAVVNARLTTLHAKVAGTLSLAPRELGSLVSTGETLGAIDDSLVDDIRLNDLILEKAVAEAERERLDLEIERIRSAIGFLEARAASYASERVRQLEARMEAARAASRAIEARLDEAQSALGRSEELKKKGVETAAALDRARAARRIAEHELEASGRELDALEVELTAARSGIFLGDGYNDAPYSEQRISELTLEMNQLAARSAAEAARAKALEERIEAERRRVNRLASSPILANVQGRLWSILAANGEELQRGQDVLRLVDCGSLIVTLSVAELVYNTLKIGDPARFRFSGKSTVLDGTVVRLAGSGAETIYANLAVAPSRQHLERYDVALAVPGLRGGGEDTCAIGRTGRVFFESRPLDWFRRLFS